MNDHIASRYRISRDDSDYTGPADKDGMQKARGVCGKDMDALM